MKNDKNWAIKQELLSAKTIYDADTGEHVATVKHDEDATLIAAAPDLYSSAMSVVETAPLDTTNPLFILALKNLITAVKKARGKK